MAYYTTRHDHIADRFWHRPEFSIQIFLWRIKMLKPHHKPMKYIQTKTDKNIDWLCQDYITIIPHIYGMSRKKLYYDYFSPRDRCIEFDAISTFQCAVEAKNLPKWAKLTPNWFCLTSVDTGWMSWQLWQIGSLTDIWSYVLQWSRS